MPAAMVVAPPRSASVRLISIISMSFVPLQPFQTKSLVCPLPCLSVLFLFLLGIDPNAKLPFADNWSEKAIRRKTTGTGRTSHLRKVSSRTGVLRKTNQIWAGKVAAFKKAVAKKLTL